MKGASAGKEGLLEAGDSTGLEKERIAAMNDPINPDHYKDDYVMRIIEDFKLDFMRGTIVKYLLRAGNKEGATELQDLQKAQWYLDRAIKQKEAKELRVKHGRN
jgi:hypothetical protein